MRSPSRVSTLALTVVLGAAAQSRAQVPPSPLLDGFEGAWGINEELVGPCYGRGIGQVDRDWCPADGGRDQCLIVHANSAATVANNHVIADLFALRHGVMGRWRYAVDARIDGQAPDGEAGPEFSAQSTRAVGPGETRTFIAGIQYQGNPSDPPPYRWAVWTRRPDGTAGWVVFAEGQGVKLDPDVWYRLILEFNLTANRYLRFKLIRLTDGAVLIDRGLWDRVILGEDRGFDPALHLTLEAENLNRHCAGVSVYRLYYDALRFTQMLE